MNDNMIFETLKELHKKESNDNSKRKEPCCIYRDEETNQIKEVPLSKLDSAGSAYINRTTYKNPLRLIHDSIFGK
jgi:hypothetical protein